MIFEQFHRDELENNEQYFSNNPSSRKLLMSEYVRKSGKFFERVGNMPGARSLRKGGIFP